MTEEVLQNVGRLEFADASTIYQMTGCLSACEKDRFEIRMSQITETDKTSEYGEVNLWLYISMRETSYVQEEQYFIYDINSFIADVGGYMGLLLGSSILSLFDEVEGLVVALFEMCKSKCLSRDIK